MYASQPLLKQTELSCKLYESQLIPDDKIGFCTECDDRLRSFCSNEFVLDECECYSVDTEWQPDLQDCATYVYYVFHCVL